MKPILTPEILFAIVWIEMGVILFCSVAMFVFKIYDLKHHKRTDMYKKELSKLLYHYLNLSTDAPFTEFIPRHMQKYNILLPVLEKISLQLKGPRVEHLISSLVDKYLKKRAKSWAYQHHWNHRNVASRILYLHPTKDDSKEVMHLLDDKSLINRSLTAHTAIKIGTPELVEKALNKMGHEPEIRRYTFRHALSIARPEVYEQVVDIYHESENIQTQVACLDAMSYRTIMDPMILAKEQTDNPSDQIRIQVAKMAVKFESDRSEAILLKYITDTNDSVRKIAAEGLKDYHNESSEELLTTALADPILEVRLNAAFSLKNFGHSGIKRLKTISQDLHPQAYSAARYVLTLP